MLSETRWPVIIFSRITVFGEIFDVFPMIKMPRDPLLYVDRRDAAVDTVFLLPSTEADIYASSAREDISRSTDAAVAYAAALFMLRVRGLPLGELTVKAPSGIYEIKRFGNSEKCGVLTPKCKLLYTKTVIFADKTNIKVHTMSLGDLLYNIVDCADSEMFSDDILNRLLLSAYGEKIAASAAVSRLGDGLSAKAVFLNDSDRSAALNLAFAVVSRAAWGRSECDLNVCINGSNISFGADGNSLLAFELNPSIFSFRAPDFPDRS